VTEQARAGTLGPTATAAFAVSGAATAGAIAHGGPVTAGAGRPVRPRVSNVAIHNPLVLGACAIVVAVAVVALARRIAPALLLYTAWTPVTVFARLLAVVVGFSFRVVNNRSESPS
jgi:hypothetical protein